MATYVIGGLTQVRYAPSSLLGVIDPGAWVTIPNIAPNTVKFTENSQTKSGITPEGQTTPFVNFYAPADGDTLVLSVLEQNPTLLAALYNIKYTAATTTMQFQANKKIANLAFELTTTAMKDGRKSIITFFNTEVQTTSDGNLTSTDVEKKVLTATINTYRPAGETVDYVYQKVFVNADGSVINSTTV